MVGMETHVNVTFDWPHQHRQRHRLLQSPVSDVLAELHALKLDQLHTLVSAIDGLLQCLSSSSSGNHAATAGLELAVFAEASTSVENVHALLLGLLDVHRSALGVGARVSTSGNDDSASVRIGNVEFLGRKLAVAGCEHELCEVGVEERETRLGFRVAEADVVLEHTRAGRCDHEAGEQAAAEAQVLGGHATDGRLEDLLLDFGEDGSGGDGRGSIGAHAAGVGASVALTNALVILCGRKREDSLAV